MITRNREMSCVFSTQPTNANKHKQRSRKFESWITNGGISRLQKMFFKRNVESCNKKFSSVIVSSVCSTKYPLLPMNKKIVQGYYQHT